MLSLNPSDTFAYSEKTTDREFNRAGKRNKVVFPLEDRLMKIHLALATILALTFGAASFTPAYAMGDGDDGGTKP